MQEVHESLPKAYLKQETETIIGAAIAVHRELGPGYLESIYERALCIELASRNVRFEAQAPVPVRYRGEVVGEGRIDILFDGKIVVELKAVDILAPVHTAQLLSYLKATGLRVGLLINFNVPVLTSGIKRIVR